MKFPTVREVACETLTVLAAFVIASLVINHVPPLRELYLSLACPR